MLRLFDTQDQKIGKFLLLPEPKPIPTMAPKPSEPEFQPTSEDMLLRISAM